MLGDGWAGGCRAGWRSTSGGGPPTWRQPPYAVGRVVLAASPTAVVAKARAGSAEERAARKVLSRLDKQLERLAEQEAAVNAAIAEAGQDYARLAELSAQIEALSAQRDEIESEWLAAAERVE